MRDRTYHLTRYSSCFVASEMATWFVEKGYASDRSEAVSLGRALKEHLHIVHVCREHDFKDAYLFFRFMSDGRNMGRAHVPEDG